jgi:hypothetical protein
VPVTLIDLSTAAVPNQQAATDFIPLVRENSTDHANKKVIIQPTLHG